MKTAKARLKRAAPSLRSSGARSLTSCPIRRTPPPTRWPIPSHAPDSILTGHGWWGTTAGICRVRAAVVDRVVLGAEEPVPRPEAVPDLLRGFPLGVEEVRVAIAATL